MKWHHMLPVEHVSFRGSQIVVSLTCPSDKVIDVIIENTGGQLTLTPSLGKWTEILTHSLVQK